MKKSLFCISIYYIYSCNQHFVMILRVSSYVVYYQVCTISKKQHMRRKYIHRKIRDQWCWHFTRLDSLDRNFILKKIFRASRVIFKNGIHSTRSSFHCFASSEFRVLVEYFWRGVVIFMHLQKMFCPCFTRKKNCLQRKKI